MFPFGVCFADLDFLWGVDVGAAPPPSMPSAIWRPATNNPDVPRPDPQTRLRLKPARRLARFQRNLVREIAN
jgi:hypothetical protein